MVVHILAKQGAYQQVVCSNRLHLPLHHSSVHHHPLLHQSDRNGDEIEHGEKARIRVWQTTGVTEDVTNAGGSHGAVHRVQPAPLQPEDVRHVRQERIHHRGQPRAEYVPGQLLQCLAQHLYISHLPQGSPKWSTCSLRMLLSLQSKNKNSCRLCDANSR